MLRIEADLHTHTVASGHAYSTVTEMARAAAEKGLKLIAITDHGPAMPGGPHEYYFGNLSVLPEEIFGVRILKGIEANIQSNGELDLPEKRLKQLDFVAAGIHRYAGYENTSKTEHTEATIRAIKNPLVKMITHPANLYFPVDLLAVVQAAAEYEVILEVNASSFDRFRLGKRGSKELSVKLCCLAKRYGVLLSLNSDAHFHRDVGNIETLSPVIKEAKLSERDIINSSFDLVEAFISRKGVGRQRCAL